MIWIPRVHRGKSLVMAVFAAVDPDAEPTFTGEL